MGVANKNGRDRFDDFIDSEVQCLFYKNRSAENSQMPSPWLFFRMSPPIHACFRHQKSFILFFQEVCQIASPGRASLKDPMQLNTNALRNADVMTSSIRATSHCSVASKKC
jgi:hypothetical protein